MMEDDYKCICGLGEEHTADCATYNSGREVGRIERGKEVVEKIEDLIIGWDNCIVLDMNKGQWQTFKKDLGL